LAFAEVIVQIKTTPCISQRDN